MTLKIFSQNTYKVKTNEDSWLLIFNIFNSAIQFSKFAQLFNCKLQICSTCNSKIYILFRQTFLLRHFIKTFILQYNFLNLLNLLTASCKFAQLLTPRFILCSDRHFYWDNIRLFEYNILSVQTYNIRNIFFFFFLTAGQ